MLFAQIQAPPTTPTAPTAGEVRESTDTRTTRGEGETKLKDPNDTRTTRDDQFDPLAPGAPMTQKDRLAYDPAFQSSPALRNQSRIAEEDGTVFRPGGVDYGAQVALIEGYNDNVVQTQNVLDGPVTRHPSPFTGVDIELNLRTWTSPFDPHEFRIQVRAQHYTPLENFDQPDDGAVIASYTGQFTLGKRDVLVNRFITTVATLNSSRLSDGPLFLVEPASLQRTFTLTNARMQLTHEIAQRWRYLHGVDIAVGTTLHDAPVQTGTQLIAHRGLDFIQPGTDGQITYDLTDSDIVSFKLRYEQSRNYFLLDFTKQPAEFLGVATTHVGEATAGLTHSFSESLRWLTSVGFALATAPPLDPDTRLIGSPVGVTELLLTKQYWLFNVNASYTYGSASPRLGFGPSAQTSSSLSGYPFPHTVGLRNLAVLLSGTANRSAFRTTDALSRISYVAASLEGRYALNRWLGILGGYNYRYVLFEGAQAQPNLYRHVFFLGLSGYWNTDRTLPLLTTFSAPLSAG
jgi:hypothetical protein